jgi:hypothetical protein
MEIIVIVLLLWIVILIIKAAFQAGSKTLEVGVEAGCEYIDGRAKGDGHDKALRSAAVKGLDVVLQRKAGIPDEKTKITPDENNRESHLEDIKPFLAYGAMDSIACCCECRKKVYSFQSLSGDVLLLDALNIPGEVHGCCLGEIEVRKVPKTDSLWQKFHFVGLSDSCVKGRFINGNKLGSVHEFEILRNDGENWSHFWRYEPVFIMQRELGVYRIESVSLHAGHIINLSLDVKLRTNIIDSSG